MKFSSATLAYVLYTSSSSCSSAFVPNSLLASRTTSQNTKTKTKKTIAFLRNDDKKGYSGIGNNDNWAFYSTTEANNKAQETVVPSSSTTTTSSTAGDIAEIIGVSEANVNDIDIKTTTKKQHSREARVTTADEARSLIKDYMKQYVGESGASIVYSKLQEHNTKVVNGYSGGANLPLLDQFHQDHPRHTKPNAPPQIRWITNSNESSAGHVAEGIAKSMPINYINTDLDPDDIEENDKPVGVAIATSGPGVTNLITPLQDAICDGVPMVVLCGQAATVAPKDAFQSAPAVAMTEPCTKWSYQIKSAAELPFVMDYAFYVARNGRPGPVFVDLPKDLQNQILTDDAIDTYVDNTFTNVYNDDDTSTLDNNDNNDNNNSILLARLMKKRRDSDNQEYHALHIGKVNKGLSFEVVNDSGEKLKLNSILSNDSKSIYHADHHPTDTIYKPSATTTKINEQEEGPLTSSESESSDTKLVNELHDLLLRAKKPIIIAGQGCNDCPVELQKFAETLHVPVTSTLHALGSFDERHNLALNMMGMHGHPTPNFMIQEADLVICIGSRFDDRITGRAADFVPEARKAAEEGRGGIVHVDIRLTENGKQIKPTYFVHSTGKKFLQTMNNKLLSAAKNNNNNNDVGNNTKLWIERMKELQKEYPVRIPHFETQQVQNTGRAETSSLLQRTPMSAQSVITEMNKQLLSANKMEECIFSTGVGIHQMVAAQLITWTKPRQMLSSGSLGTMGVSLGYCIGAKLANGNKICISIDGDGSFNMTFTELKTVAEQKIPVKLMILDNEGQMMVEYWQRLFHDARYLAVRNDINPDYSMLAQSFGIKSLYCDCEEDLPAKMNEFLLDDPDEPVLFHVRIKRTPCLPLVAPGEAIDNMILEDIDFEVDLSAAPS